MKKYLKVMIITSIIILLPMLAGLILWDQLPEQMPTHWNINGEVDGWTGKAFAVFGTPLIMLGVQWLCLFATLADPKKQNHSDKVLHMVLWIVPVLTLLLGVSTYMSALGRSVPVEMITSLILGLVFIVLGNYMPKCKQSYTIGIKLPWTLNSEENWNKTHRFAGRIWVICGVAMLGLGLLGSLWLVLGISVIAILAPTVYSYKLHRKGI